MPRITLKSWNMSVAFVAAYMLVLQALIGAFALGAASASPMLDAFGNPLCITSMDGTGTEPDRTDHAAVPECCSTLCGMFAPATADDRAPHSLSNPLVAGSKAHSVRIDTVPPVRPLARGPGNPRAPPFRT